MRTMTHSRPTPTRSKTCGHRRARDGHSPRIPPHRWTRCKEQAIEADPPRAATPGREVGRAESRTGPLVADPDGRGGRGRRRPRSIAISRRIAELVQVAAVALAALECAARGAGAEEGHAEECQQVYPLALAQMVAGAVWAGGRAGQADRHGAMRRDRRSSARGAGARGATVSIGNEGTRAYGGPVTQGGPRAYLFVQTGGKRPEGGGALHESRPTSNRAHHQSLSDCTRLQSDRADAICSGSGRVVARRVQERARRPVDDRARVVQRPHLVASTDRAHPRERRKGDDGVKRDPHYGAARAEAHRKLRAASYAAIYPRSCESHADSGTRLRSTAARRATSTWWRSRGRGSRALPMNSWRRSARCSGGTETASGATEKAHGRVAHTIYFGMGAHSTCR